MCISQQSEKTSQDNLPLSQAAMLWNVAGFLDWCFYDTPVVCSGIQPRKNVLLDISVINHSELEKRGLAVLQTKNQDNSHKLSFLAFRTKMLCFQLAVLIGYVHCSEQYCFNIPKERDNLFYIFMTIKLEFHPITHRSACAHWMHNSRSRGQSINFVIYQHKYSVRHSACHSILLILCGLYLNYTLSQYNDWLFFLLTFFYIESLTYCYNSQSSILGRIWHCILRNVLFRSIEGICFSA